MKNMKNMFMTKMCYDVPKLFANSDLTIIICEMRKKINVQSALWHSIFMHRFFRSSILAVAMSGILGLVAYKAIKPY